MPPDAIYVGRPTRWGNPYRPGRTCCFGGAMLPPLGTGDWEREVRHERFRAVCPDVATSVVWYCELLSRCPTLVNEARHLLRGHDLACWCPLDQPCHADVLIELTDAGF